MRTVRDDSENVAAWVADKIPHVGQAGFGNCKAIGVVSKTGEAMCGVVFHDYQPMARTIQLSMASSTPRWITKNIVRDILSYPFEELGLFKVWTVMPLAAANVQRFGLGIGFRRDGILRHQFGPKQHAVFLSMIAPEFGEKYGKTISTVAA